MTRRYFEPEPDRRSNPSRRHVDSAVSSSIVGISTFGREPGTSSRRSTLPSKLSSYRIAMSAPVLVLLPLDRARRRRRLIDAHAD
jgi:hypothetical protein